MKILFTYSSKTGNTKKICSDVFENIKNDFTIDFCTIKEITNHTNYDAIIIGYWVDRGTANHEAKRLMTKIKNKPLALIGTLGAAPDSEHAIDTINNVNNLVDKSNNFAGIFLARGKVTEKLTKAIKYLPLPRHVKNKIYDASINSRPPNKEEIYNATEFIKKFLAAL